MYKLLIFLLCVISVIVGTQVDTISKDIRIKNVDRTIDITSQLVKQSSKITFENVGSSPIKSVLLAVSKEENANIAFIGAKDTSNKDLKLSETLVQGNENSVFWRIELKQALAAGSSITITTETVLIKSLIPYPSEITQKQDQYVKYNGNLYYYTPYTVTSQKTTVAVNTKSIEQFTKIKPFSQADSSVSYGPFANVAPFNHKEIIFHYQNNSPFLTVTRVQRWIEVSHWGNVAIEELIEVEHTGAKLKGPFSRYNYQQEQSGASSVRSYKTLLPASASNVYYRDNNGNISTSNMRTRRDSVELDLRPRYPLFGGWKTHYTLGYNVPSYEYLFHSDNDYLLKMRIIDHIFDDMQVDEVVTKIVLPEGASNIKLNLPYPVKRLPDSVHYTYLDTKGRPVISLSKRNLVENHIQDFQLHYTYPRLLMFQEPLLVVGFLFALFICVIIYVRLDFSIHKAEQHHHKD